MRILVVDTETTGMEETDQVVELAAVSLISTPADDSGDSKYTRWHEAGRFSGLVIPSVPVSVGARATHHITDEEIMTGDPPRKVVHCLRPLFGKNGGEEVVVAAHNLDFDVRMMKQSGLAELLPARMICTWRCSLHLHPDAPGHSNQVLRYHLGVAVPPVEGPPHRALPDAVVTAAVLLRMLQEKTADELVALTTAPALLGTIRFGKHRGRKWAEVDSDYLSWVLRSDFGPDEKHTARHWLNERRRGPVSAWSDTGAPI